MLKLSGCSVVCWVSLGTPATLTLLFNSESLLRLPFQSRAYSHRWKFTLAMAKSWEGGLPGDYRQVDWALEKGTCLFEAG